MNMFLIYIPLFLSTTDVLSELEKELHVENQDRGTFVQEQHLSGFSKVLTSRGKFLFVQGKGMLWDVLDPVPSELTVTKSKMILHYENQNEVEIKQPEISQILLSIFQGNLILLKNVFDVELEKNKKKWKLSLKTKQEQMAKFIKKIILTGERQVEQVIIEESNGDWKKINIMHGSQKSVLAVQENDRFKH